MCGTKALCECAMNLMIVAAFPRRIDQLGPEDDELVAATAVKIVVLKEHGCRQHNVSGTGSFRHELLMDAHEQILAGKASLHPLLIRRDRKRVGVLDEERRHLGPSGERVIVAFQDGTDA